MQCEVTAEHHPCEESRDRFLQADGVLQWSALSHADEKMAGWQSDMSAYQNKLRARSAEIERQKNQMVANCKSQCGQGTYKCDYCIQMVQLAGQKFRC